LLNENNPSAVGIFAKLVSYTRNDLFPCGATSAAVAEPTASSGYIKYFATLHLAFELCPAGDK
jgi:hypothetical protein